MSDALLWPDAYDAPADLAAVEDVPLAERGLPATTYDLLARAATLWPDRPAVTVLPDAARWQSPVRRTYADLLADVHRFANVLHRVGVRRTDAVALIAPNCDQLITATLAAELAGIATPINGALSAQHVRHLLHLSGARVAIVASPDADAGAWQQVRQLAVGGLLDTVLILDATGVTDSATPQLDGVEVLHLATAARDADGGRFVGEPPAAHDLASFFHTGGTTGAPKLAAHTHRNEVVDAWSIAANTALDDRATLFAGLPLFHVNALVVTLLSPMLRGQHAVWAGPLGYRDPALYGCFWRLVEHYGVNTMSGVPTVYAVLGQVPVDADISSLRFAIVGASMLPNGVRRAFEESTGVPLIEGYGLTEATCGSTRGFALHPRPGAVGQRFPYQQLKAVRVEDDGSWTDLPAGETGTIVIGGPTTFPGYVTGRDADGSIVLDGLGKLVGEWVDTGDLGFVDPDGFLHLTGRAKDLIIRGGHNIDPRMVEDALLSHPHVTGASGVGMPDAHSGEVPVVYITVSASVDPDELLMWARDHVAEPAAAPKAVHVLEALPVTAVGKPYKLPLRADAVQRALAAALAERLGEGTFEVRGQVEEGDVTAVIVVDPARVDDVAVKDVMDAFTVQWRMET